MDDHQIHLILTVMKTIRIITIFSLFLFIGMTAVFSEKIPGNNIQKQIIATHYLVNVHFSSDVSLCNPYLVEVVDESGHAVAAPQVFQPLLGVYSFYEKGPVKGTRTAILIPDTGLPHFVCPNEIFTTKDSETGNFWLGQTYPFNLYPTVYPPVPVPIGSVSAVGVD